MQPFDPENDSALLLKWWIDLTADPVEFENLLAKPLRNLVGLAGWMKSGDVRFFYESDAKGFWIAAWITPLMTHGAEVGAWIRKDKRGTRQALRAMDNFYEMVLEKAACLIGVTRQYPALHELHLKLGYTYVGVFEGIFDGHDAHVYKMTRGSRDARHEVANELRRRRREAREQQLQYDGESLRADVGAIRGSEPEGRGTRYSKLIESSRRGVANWWSKQSDSNHQPPG